MRRPASLPAMRARSQTTQDDGSQKLSEQLEVAGIVVRQLFAWILERMAVRNPNGSSWICAYTGATRKINN
ncbi:hypothetical protein [Bradyrhizobium cenepequi]